MSREKQVCSHVIPVYYGNKGIGTRGNPFGGAKDYYFQCYFTKNKNKGDCRQTDTIKDLCEGCRQYVRPLTKQEIKEKYYDGKDREILVVTPNRWYFKKN